MQCAIFIMMEAEEKLRINLFLPTNLLSLTLSASIPAFFLAHAFSFLCINNTHYQKSNQNQKIIKIFLIASYLLQIYNYTYCTVHYIPMVH